MKRDTLKTLAGLVIIGGIVVATFLYGNAQRKTQLAHDQEVKKQQEAKTQSPSPSATSVAAASPTQTPTPTNNTAPVQSPGSNNIQGAGKAATPSPTPTPSPKATASPVPATGAVQGANQVAGGNLPETGPEMAGMLGFGAISGMVIAVRRSRRAVVAAARAKR